MKIKTYNIDNMVFDSDEKYDLVFADYMYENSKFDWALKFWQYLKPNSVMVAMTDWHTVHRYRVFMEDIVGVIFVNSAVWKNEWGRGPSNRLHQCFDDVVIYANDDSWTFDSSKIQVPKATANTKLNPSGRMTKTATCWIDDCVLTTTSRERVKKDDGHLVEYQKPLSLYRRIISPFVKENTSILDIFAGSMSLGKYCQEMNFDYTAIEYDESKYRYGLGNLYS